MEIKVKTEKEGGRAGEKEIQRKCIKKIEQLEKKSPTSD